MKKHYFKQRIYPVDRLKNRECYLEVAIMGYQKENQEFIMSSQEKGTPLSYLEIKELKDQEQKARMIANKDFSSNFWKQLRSQDHTH